MPSPITSGDVQVPRRGATSPWTMHIDDCDVPELVSALADRFAGYDIGPREARHITVEMLDAAFAEQADFEDATLPDMGREYIQAIRRRSTPYH